MVRADLIVDRDRLIAARGAFEDVAEGELCGRVLRHGRDNAARDLLRFGQVAARDQVFNFL